MSRNFLLYVLVFCVSLTGCYKPYEIQADIMPPGDVTNLVVNKLDVDVKFSWDTPADGDLVGYNIALYNSANQRLIQSKNISKDTTEFVMESVAPGNYYVVVRTRDKQNNLSEGSRESFIFLSKAPVNVQRISTAVNWNVIHVRWDSLTAADFVTEVEGQSISIPVDSIIVEVDSAYRRYVLPATATGAVIPDLPDGVHYVRVYTHGTSGYYSGVYSQTFSPIKFGEKFVRVTGNGHDFYISKYEVTTEEYRKFIVDDLNINEATAPYRVDNSKVEADAWFKWWYGIDPATPGLMKLLGFNTYEFTLSPAEGWAARRYPAQASFGRATWQGAMLYSLVNYNGRCPTIDEWLYAAKGGALSKGYDYAGSNDPDAVGWWGWVSGGVEFLKAPGLKQPNELGIYDMSGNASEYTYQLDPNGTVSLGKSVIIGGSMGPIHFWGNEGEDFGPDNSLKPKLSDPAIVKKTGVKQSDALWRMGIRVLIPHEEIIKPRFNRFKYEP